jgi:predicted Zn-dependent protease
VPQSIEPGGFASSQGATRTLVELGVILLALIGVILTGRLVVGCAAERAALALPTSVDAKVGEAASRAIRAGHGDSSPAPEQAARVEKVFQGLVARLRDEERGTLGTPEVTVLVDETPNAFALPGGQVFVFTGLLDRLGEGEMADAQLRGVLAHELGHAVERHSLRLLARRVAFGVVVGLLMGNGDQLGDALLAGASQLEGLRNSREMETEADDFGVDLLARANLDARGLAVFLEGLETQPVPALLSTHPDPKERAARIRERLPR